MSNLDIIQSLYRLFAEHDGAGIRRLMHPAIVWVQMDGFPNGGQHRGPDAVFERVFAQFKDHWTSWRAIPQEFLDAGESVVVIGRYAGTYARTGAMMTAAFAHRYIVREGVIVRFEQYTDTRRVAEATAS